MSPKKKKDNKKPSLEGIVNKLSSVAKAQQEEKGKGDTPTKVTKPVKLSSKKMPVKPKMSINVSVLEEMEFSTNSSESWNLVSKLTIVSKPSLWQLLIQLKAEEASMKANDGNYY